MIMGSGAVTLPAKRMPDPNHHLSSNGPTKRSKKPSSPAAAAPLVVPAGHASFRLLCHASRIGGVIGRSGSVIKQLQQATGGKIRVENATAESPDRVITVVAPAAPAATKIVLRSPIIGGGGSGGGDAVMEVSKAQEALLRVFDRILEVAAEGGALGIGVGVVSCRMLADKAQASSVIGKGGKVVEKIRKESGSKIRVLTEKLPACAAATDEMIEIEGNVLAVKKALIAVSCRIQECPSVDKTRANGSRNIEAVPKETSPVDLHVNHLSQRHLVMPTLNSRFINVPGSSINYPTSSINLQSSSINLPNRSINLPSSSIIYASGVRPLSMESERAPIPGTKIQMQEIVFKILCANDKVGGVIGKGGAIVKAVQNETGAAVSVGASVAECDERLITVTATENPESRYSPAQKAVVLVFSRSIDGGTERGQDSGSSKGSSVTARLVVPSNQVGCLLGKGGVIVSEMRKVTGANIRVIGRGNPVPKCVSENDEVVQISGDFPSVQDALYNATGRLRDNFLSSTVSSVGTRSAPSLLTDTSPYERVRDPAPLGISVSPQIGVDHSVSQHTTLDQSVDHLGLSHTLDRPPSPRPWISQMVAGVGTRGVPDTGRGVPSLKGGLELGSGTKSAIVTNTTVEIVVPERVISSVYGENGSNLTRLRQISGARVIVHEPRPGSSDRIIVISGTPDETQAAQSLLHAFILTGPA